MREKFVPKEVVEFSGNPGEDGDKVCLEGMVHSFGCVAAIHIGGNELEG